MKKKIICTSNADNWFFCCKNTTSHHQEFHFFRLCVWVTYDDGEIVGYYNCGKIITDPSDKEGIYVHWNDLDDEQRKEAMLQCRIRPSYYEG